MISSIDFCMNKRPDCVLLIDNSNTRTKLLCVSDEIRESELLVLPTAELSVETLKQAVSGMVYSRAVICSVVPSKRAVFNEALRCPCHFLSVNSPTGLTFRYDSVSVLGADRIANAAAIAEYGLFPCVAVDVGTATTFDVVMRQGHETVFLGGAIAPGMQAFTEYLHRCTAQLPKVCVSEPCGAIATNTVDAIKSGALYGFCGMVKELISRIEKELGQAVHVFLTGGDAPLLSRMIGRDSVVDSWLTLRGLLRVARHI